MRGEAGDLMVGRITAKAKEIHCHVKDCDKLLQILQKCSSIQLNFIIFSTSPGGLPNPGIQPRSSSLQADSIPAEPPGKQMSGSTCQIFLDIYI